MTNLPVSFRLIHRLQGRSTVSLFEQRLDAQWDSNERIAQRQLTRLQELVEASYRNVPYYRGLLKGNLSSKPEIDSQEAFSERVPLMSKSELRVSLAQLHADEIRGRLIVHATSGSTGQPLKLPRDPLSVSAFWADKLLTRSWWGVSTGDWEATIWGYAIKSQSRLQAAVKRTLDQIKRLLSRTLYLSAYDMDDASIRAFVADITQRGPTSLYGYVSALERFACFVQENGVDLQLPERAVVIPTAEAMSEEQRAFMNSAFDRPIANEYGCSEAGILAFECPDGSMHLLEETSYVEVVDDAGRPIDGLGNLVVTSLHNFSVPLIRYGLGDIGEISEESCSCGRGGRLLSTVLGRKWSTLQGTNGQRVNPLMISALVKELAGVERFQAVQDALDHVEIRLVCDRMPDVKDMGRVRSRLRQQMGGATRVDFTQVRDIPLEPSGKFLAVKCLLNR
jgi:phenylacetate-CoA ligase